MILPSTQNPVSTTLVFCHLYCMALKLKLPRHNTSKASRVVPSGLSPWYHEVSLVLFSARHCGSGKSIHLKYREDHPEPDAMGWTCSQNG